MVHQFTHMCERNSRLEHSVGLLHVRVSGISEENLS